MGSLPRVAFGMALLASSGGWDRGAAPTRGPDPEGFYPIPVQPGGPPSARKLGRPARVLDPAAPC